MNAPIPTKRRGKPRMNDQAMTMADAPAIEWVRTEDLSRSPESQVRDRPDAALVAEYAQAMLEGAEFPPVTIFRNVDDGYLYLADGHHRVDAAALAALRDPRRKAEVRAEIRPGTFQDALRHAMAANRLHGKRMVEADYRRAIRMAFDNGLVHAANAKDVVPELVELTGCSIRVAQLYSAEQRKALIAKRDRLILALHAKGTTQEDIGEQIGVTQSTVASVVARSIGKRSASFADKPARVPPPRAEQDSDEDDETSEDPAGETQDPPAARVTYEVNKGYLPLLDALRPVDEGGDDLESGNVAQLPEPASTVVVTDPGAYQALKLAGKAAYDVVAALDGNLDALSQPYSADDAATALAALERAAEFLDEISEYIREGLSQ